MFFLFNATNFTVFKCKKESNAINKYFPILVTWNSSLNGGRYIDTHLENEHRTALPIFIKFVAKCSSLLKVIEKQ